MVSQAQASRFYYQSIYFSFLYPLFIMMVVYDLLTSMLRIRNLASGIIVTAQRLREEMR